MASEKKNGKSDKTASASPGGPKSARAVIPTSGNTASKLAGPPVLPGRPGTFDEVRKIVESRVIDTSKIYSGPVHPDFASYPEGAPSIVEQARALKNDPQLIFEFVYDNIDWQPAWGLMKGPLGCLLDQGGGAWDQCSLLVALLTQAGYTAEFVLGQIQLTTAQFDAWFNTDSQTDNICCYNYAQTAYIPGDTPVEADGVWSMVMSHVWVQVVVDDTTYVLDPSYKTYNRATTVAVGGSITAGDTVTITVSDAGLSGGTASVSYTVLSTDTLGSIAVALSNGINTDTSLSAIGVTSFGSLSPAQLTISSRSSNPTTYTVSTSGGATETLTITSPVAGLATILGYDASTFLSDALTGADTDGTNYIANTNHANIGSDLQDMTASLITWLEENVPDASVDQILGGQTIVPITLPFTWQTSLAYEYSVADTWSAVPMAYKTTLQVQYFEVSEGVWDIDQTFYSDQLAGSRLTLTFNGGHYPVLTLNGTVVQTGTTAQTGTNDPNTATLTVTHNAYPIEFDPYTQNFIYAGQYYLIGNSWGDLGPGQLTYHQIQLAAALANSLSTSEAINGEWMSTNWFNWATQNSRVSDLLGRINNTYMIYWHQVGMTSLIFNDGVPSAGTDLQGIRGFAATLTADTSQISITNTIADTHSVALEAATCAQFNGVIPGISTTAVIDKANRTALITIGGTISVGDTLTITVHDPAISGGSSPSSYTVASGDTLNSIASHLNDAINSNINLAPIGIFALPFENVIWVAATGPNQTSYTSSVSAGATETIAIAFSKIYSANDSNWTTGIGVRGILYDNGYTEDYLETLDGYAGTPGEIVLIGDYPVYILGLWVGDGYWVFFDYSLVGEAIGNINGGLAGGSGNSGNGQQQIPSKPGIDPQDQPTGGEPIGMFTGDFFYSNTDITIGSQSYPYSLPFTRTYSSANQYVNGPLGWGWTHNHEITAKIGSDGLLAMGNQFAAQAASTIAALYVAMDLGSDATQPIAKLITMNLTDKWWIDQLVNNTVVVSFSNANQIFVKQPDGSYIAPSDFPSILTLSGGLYTVTTPQGMVFDFNSSGQISTIASPSGVTISYSYSSGALSTVSNGMGRTLTLNYTSGRLTSVSDGTGRAVHYAFDGSGDLTTFTDALLNDIVYQYDQPGRMTKYFLPANPTTAFVDNVYDSLSRVETQADALGNVTSCYFAGSRTEMDDPVGNAQVLYFSSLGSVTRSIDALGFETDSVFDGLSRVIQITYPEGNKVQLTYDTNNNILTKTFVPKPGSGLSNIQRVYTYSTTWAKVETAQDGNGNITTFGYDPTLGNLTSVVGPTVTGGAPQVVMTYNGRGQVITQKVYTSSTDFIETQFNYDSTTEKMTSVVADYSSGGGHLNLTTSFGYDSVGNCTSVTDPNSNETNFAFDNERRRTQMTAPTPFSFITNWAYDQNGNLTSVAREFSSPAFQTTGFAYTVTNKLFTVTDPLLRVTTYGYDGADRLKSVVDAQGREWQYAYDPLNRIYTVTDPTSTVCDTRAYTDNGYLASIEDANSNVTQFGYDGLDRLSITTFADSTTQQNSSYDANGNVLTYLPRAGSSYPTTLTYDALNRLVTKSPSGQAEISYFYDLSSRLTELTKAGSGDPSCGNFQFFYDTAGRFYQEEYPDSKTVTHVLDNNGNRTKTTWPDGYYVTRSFDQLNRLTNIYLNGSGTSSAAFGYDQLSRRILLTLGNGAVVDYAYALNNDLTELTNTFVGAYQRSDYLYNNVHQAIGATLSDSSFLWEPSASATTVYGTADDVNKYPTVGPATLTYDGNKNLTFDGIYTYSFDIENHLLSVYLGGTFVASYVYDPQQRQAQKTVGSTSTRFIYSGNQLIADYNGSTLINRYICGGANEPLIQVTGAGAISYFHQDNHRSVIARTNNVGALTNKYAYSPFGESSALSGTTLGFTGQRYDAETGLYYFKARYYSPSLGRFLQTDPIGYSGGGLNLYTYGVNDPINTQDPSGLAPTSAGSSGPGLLSLLSPPSGCGGSGSDLDQGDLDFLNSGFGPDWNPDAASSDTGLFVGSVGPMLATDSQYPNVNWPTGWIPDSFYGEPPSASPISVPPLGGPIPYDQPEMYIPGIKTQLTITQISPLQAAIPTWDASGGGPLPTMQVIDPAAGTVTTVPDPELYGKIYIDYGNGAGPVPYD